MDNNSYEQEFQQNLQASMAQPVANNTGSSKLPLVISIALAAIVLVESIALLVTLNNYFSIMNEGEESEEFISEDQEVDGVYVYDDDYNLTAMNVTCTAEDGAKFVLTDSKNYQEFDNSSSQISSGSYSILNDSLVSLSGTNNNQERVLYYDGFSLADGTTLYNCEEDVPGSAETE